MALRIRRLLPEDDRSGFRSGNPDLDRFFIRFAGQNQFKHHLGTTYLALEGELIVGFVTVASSELVAAELPPTMRKRLPGYPVPVLRLARMAGDLRARGRGVGTVVLQAVFALARQMATDFGCTGVVVDAKPDAVAFYARFGFAPLELTAGALGDRPEPVAMFLPLGELPAVK